MDSGDIMKTRVTLTYIKEFDLDPVNEETIKETKKKAVYDTLTFFNAGDVQLTFETYSLYAGRWILL